METLFRALIVLLGIGLVAAPAAAEPVRQGDIVVVDAWARASIVSNGAAYVTIRNEGDAAERLLGASSAVARRVEIHESRVEGGIMRMRRIDRLEIPQGQTVALEPGGYHLMLMGLENRLAEGGNFELTLRFERAGEVTLTVPVRPMGAGGGGGRLRRQPN